MSRACFPQKYTIFNQIGHTIYQCLSKPSGPGGPSQSGSKSTLVYISLKVSIQWLQDMCLSSVVWFIDDIKRHMKYDYGVDMFEDDENTVFVFGFK